jgi:hypothetical protein
MEKSTLRDKRTAFEANLDVYRTSFTGQGFESNLETLSWGLLVKTHNAYAKAFLAATAEEVREALA